MDIFTVSCPKCGKGFYADMLLYTLDVELHCPSCDAYFKKEASPTFRCGKLVTAAVARIPGGLKPEMIFKPERNEQLRVQPKAAHGEGRN
jgi:NAD-dependent SIR2 family protein deacetylase